MAKQPFVRTANFTDISKKLKPIAGMIGQNQALGNIPQLATAMSSNEQILKANPAVPNLATTGKSATQIGSGFLAEDKRELNSDETEFALENFARLPKNIQEQLIASGQAPQGYMGKEDIGDFLKTYNLPDSKYGTPSDRDLMNQTFGVSGTDLSKEDAGALPKDAPKATTKTTALSAVDYAKQIAEGLYDGQTGSEPDWGVASLLYFSKLAENASKPGATFLGAAGSAGSAPAAYLMQKEKEKADLELKKKATIASLVPSIISAQKPKKSFSTLTKDQAEKLGYDTKEGKITYQLTSEGEVKQVTKTDKGVSVSVGDKTKQTMGSEIAKMNVKELKTFREASVNAITSMKNIDDLLTMLANPELNTGFKEEKFMLPLREIGNALGFDVDVSKIVNAQAFRAKTFEIVLQNVSKMKGALSDKELKFLENMNANLGMQKDANKILLLSTRHALSKAARFNQFALDWQLENTIDPTTGEPTGITSSIQYQNMIQDFQNDPQNNLNPLDYIQGLADKEEIMLIKEYGGEVAPIGEDGALDYVDGSLTPEQEQEIQQILENKFSMSLLDKTFKNYFSRGESAYTKKKKDK